MTVAMDLIISTDDQNHFLFVFAVRKRIVTFVLNETKNYSEILLSWVSTAP